MNEDSEILIVEDSSLQAEMLRRLLEENGYHVVLAASGKEALSQLRSSVPRLIISDILMPDMDGYELCAEVKRDRALRRIPILLLTTLTDPEDIIRGLEAHADGYLTKPFDPDYLLNKVRSVLAAPDNGKGEESPLELKVNIGGKAFTVTADPRSFFDLLLSTYENTVHTNHSLLKVRAELEELNRQLELKVTERTDHLAKEMAFRERAEEALRESYERFRSVVEAAHDPIIGIDTFGKIVMWNSAATRTFGYSVDEVMGEPVTILMPERYRQQHENAVDRARESGQLYYAKHVREVAGLRKDGTEFPLETSLSAWRTRKGMFFTAVVRDITERKQAEEALLESHERFRSVVEAANDAIIGADSRGCINMWNAAAARSFGYTEEEVLDQPLTILMPERFHKLHQKALDKAVAEGHLAHKTRVRQVAALRKDGTEFPAEVSLSAWKRQGSMFFTGIIRDITERKQAEESLKSLSKDLLARNEQLTSLTEELKKQNEEVQLKTQQLWHAAKLATIGELAASIAHELNNPLATVSLRTEGMLLRTPPDYPGRHSLEIIEQEVERMGNLVANLLQFSRRYQPRFSTIDVREEMDKTLELIRGHLRNHHITVERNCLSNLRIHADRQQLAQVFLNLFTNARDGMPNGGTLSIRTGFVEDKPGYVLIQIGDTGTGIAPEDLAKVMEPFFTTKPEGRGTGLGLPICKRIIHDHGGSLHLTSEVGKGTTVSIVLPAANVHHTNSVVVDTKSERI